MDQFPKFFHHMIRKNIPYVHITKISTTWQYVATLSCESRKSKNVTKFLR